jgi:hypothetical protein
MQVVAPGAPSGRRSHATLVLQERFLVVHGGYDGRRYLSDMHVYDTLSQAWICPLLHREWVDGWGAEVGHARRCVTAGMFAPLHGAVTNYMPGIKPVT